jgi:hypothetical protein
MQSTLVRYSTKTLVMGINSNMGHLGIPNGKNALLPRQRQCHLFIVQDNNNKRGSRNAPPF